MLPEKTRIKILLEIEQINQLLSTYDDLLVKCQANEPDKIEIAALGSVLHSFYNGLEIYSRLLPKNLINSCRKV